MWVLLTIVCILARVVFGSPESAGPFLDVTRSENQSADTLGNRSKKSGLWPDAPTKWNGEPLAMEANRIGIDPDADKYTEESQRKVRGELDDMDSEQRIDSNVPSVAKRRDTANSWFDVPANEKEFQDSSQEKKDHWPYWWEDKRIGSYAQNPDIRRPIRMPFNSWLGKRGRWPYVTMPGKRARNLDAGESEGDGDHDGNPVRSRLTVSSSSIDDSPAVRPFDTSAADEFPKAYDTRTFKDEPNMTRGKNEIPEGNNADVGDRRMEFCTLIPARRARGKTPFNMWGRKRNLKNKYLEMPSRPAKQGDVFFPWAG